MIPEPPIPGGSAEVFKGFAPPETLLHKFIEQFIRHRLCRWDEPGDLAAVVVDDRNTFTGIRNELCPLSAPAKLPETDRRRHRPPEVIDSRGRPTPTQARPSTVFDLQRETFPSVHCGELQAPAGSTVLSPRPYGGWKPRVGCTTIASGGVAVPQLRIPFLSLRGSSRDDTDRARTTAVENPSGAPRSSFKLATGPRKIDPRKPPPTPVSAPHSTTKLARPFARFLGAGKSQLRVDCPHRLY
jgi:hypothetical protein